MKTWILALVMGGSAAVSMLVTAACVSRTEEPQREAIMAPAAPSAAPEASLYDLELLGLTDADGRARTLDAFRGHPVVVSMFYAACPTACPALMTEMKAMDAALTPAAREDVRYLLVSFDPARDDTAALAKARATHGLDARWTLARTDEREVRVLATALGLRYRFQADGEIDHSTNLTLVRPDGGMDVQVDGLGQGKDEMIARIDELASRPLQD